MDPLIIVIFHREAPLDEAVMLSREEVIAGALDSLTRAREDLDAAAAELAQAKRQLLRGTGDREPRAASWEAARAQCRAASGALDEANRAYQWARAR